MEENKERDTLLETADLLLKRLKETLEADDAPEGQSLRQYTATLKDLMRIRGVRSGADAREQEARIRKLCREAERGSEDRTVSVVLSGNLEEWAK